jgi:hypothetical protein
MGFTMRGKAEGRCHVYNAFDEFSFFDVGCYITPLKFISIEPIAIFENG